jgi:hypothetical protein
VLRIESPGAAPRRVQLPIRGARAEVTLQPGISRIACELHEGEIAHVLVSEHPYAEVVGEGSVRFSDLPPPARDYDAWIARVGKTEPPVLTRATVHSAASPDEAGGAAGTSTDEPPANP